MKFFVLAALFATIAFAAPAEDAKAISTNANSESSTLKNLLANSAGHQAKYAEAPPGCYYAGTAPFCRGSCDNGYKKIDDDDCGDGECCLTGSKALCCD